MNIPATIEERKSKDGKPYVCIVVKIDDEIEKLVFLTKAELKCLTAHYNKQK